MGKMHRPFRIALLAIGVLLASGVLASVIVAVQAHQRGLLWHIVQLCVIDHLDDGRPRPCLYVSLAGGYVVLADPLSRSQVLVMPTLHISGIESPKILSADVPNYWQSAWRSRRFLFHRLGRSLPRNAVGLAINSSPDRSQDQLHIHVDCLQPSVRQRLDSHADEIGTSWTELGFSLDKHRYWARLIDAPDLRGVYPFRLLADWVASRDGAMWRETLVVVGARLADHHGGFILLADSADPSHGDPGHGESLLDHSCALAG